MDTEFLVTIGSHTQLRFSVWLRGVELEVRGYVEKADRRVGIMGDSLVIEELRPLTPNPRWREPDIDDLLDTGEYSAIEAAFWDTWRSWNTLESYVFWGNAEFDYESIRENQHKEWRAYWLGAEDQSPESILAAGCSGSDL